MQSATGMHKEKSKRCLNMQTRRWSFCLLMGLLQSLKVHTTSGKTFHIPFSDDAASENEDNGFASSKIGME